MTRRTGLSIAILFLAANAASADDGRGLKRGADPKDVTISGVSSGAAMAVQYAVAHSASVAGVGSIAGPGWGCAEGSVSRAINICMCGRGAADAESNFARLLADGGKGAVDPLDSGKPKALKRSYVFHSRDDATVVAQSGEASIRFLASFIGNSPVVDWGNARDGSNHAGHGIISPDGTDACRAGGRDATYVRRCGAEDNAGKLFHVLFGQGRFYDASKRASNIPDSEIWAFDQQRIIDAVKAKTGEIAPDQYLFGFLTRKSSRRENFDLARTGYLYVPPSCRAAGSQCRVHVALHGCRQDARTFAATAGYNNWAEYYKVIVVYPAIQRHDPQLPEGVCRMAPVQPVVDVSLVEPNDNGCWDWWGYLDPGWPEQYRYLTRKAPQMQVIERIVAEVTAPERSSGR